MLKSDPKVGSVTENMPFLANMEISSVYPKSYINPCPAEPGYTLPLQKVQIQISWLLKKPTDMDLYCLPSSMQIYSNNRDQVT